MAPLMTFTRTGRSVLAIVALLLIALVATQSAAAAGAPRRVSVGPGGAQGNGDSYDPAISANGRYVAFESDASTLVVNDTNDWADVFVRDRAAGTTRRVSLGPGGAQGNDDSLRAAISANGRYVAFDSFASNLVANDTNGYYDVFVRDRKTGKTRRISVGPGGAEGDEDSTGPAVSADGRLVAFESKASNLVIGDTNGFKDVFVRDRVAGTTRRLSVGPGGAEGDGGSYLAAISADGRFVAFASDASTLVGNDTNGTSDVFLRDRVTGKTKRLSVGPGGAEGDGDSCCAAISADGRFVAFDSFASNLVANDTNGARDVFIRDRKTGTTKRLSVGPGGAEGDGGSSGAAISANGRFVVFNSIASTLVANDTNSERDIFLRDRKTGTTRRLSRGPSGSQANSDSFVTAISADGRFVAFDSSASNLIGNDSNDKSDIYVRGPLD